MNGPQDLGGQMGFGPVAPEPEDQEPMFHAPWEREALGLTLACGTFGWSLDESRAVRESLPPRVYYSTTYYDVWLRALTELLVRHGYVTREELKAQRALADGAKPKTILRPADIPIVLAKGAPVDRKPDRESLFSEGDAVRTVVMNPEHHTRLPRYARGKRGRIERVQGFHVFPDTNAHGQGEQPQWLYTVAFDGRELWGRDGDPSLSVSIDAWESYLERA
jgi:nitrile hydratase